MNLGLTGGMGCGKSTAARCFADHGLRRIGEGRCGPAFGRRLVGLADPPDLPLHGDALRTGHGDHLPEGRHVFLEGPGGEVEHHRRVARGNARGHHVQ